MDIQTVGLDWDQFREILGTWLLIALVISIGFEFAECVGWVPFRSLQETFRDIAEIIGGFGFLGTACGLCAI